MSPSRPADPDLPSTTDPVLTDERDHLVRSRASLAEMRAVAGTAGDVGGAALSSESLGAARARRLKALADDPSIPPFFGRIDRGGDEERPDGETFHVGRRHIRDGAGDPLVIDFPAPLDYALLQRLVRVQDVPGTITVGAKEMQWRLVPDSAWVGGSYDVHVDTALEDVAGNRVGRPFDVDTFDPITPKLTRKNESISFRVRP